MPKMLMTADDMVRGVVKFSAYWNAYDLVVWRNPEKYEVGVVECDAFGNVKHGAVVRRHATPPAPGDRVVIRHSQSVYTLPPLPWRDCRS